MSNYIAVGYSCNQNCIGCPIKHKRKISFSYDELKCKIDEIAKTNDLSVTLSGGEPTVHPDFLKIIDYMMKKHISVTILTNAELFYDKDFVNEFYAVSNMNLVHIITTIHSSEPETHEKQNGKIGSFEKSIIGLNNLFLKGFAITVKHCISKVNLSNTKDFLVFVNNTFHPAVDIQLWGLDYSGMEKEEAERLFVPFTSIHEALEEALDVYLEFAEKNGRRLSIHNIPLCSVDPIYWDLFVKPQEVGAYNSYYDPSNTFHDFSDDSGCNSTECDNCYVREICMGSYLSAFQFFGNEIVKSIQEA